MREQDQQALNPYSDGTLAPQQLEQASFITPEERERILIECYADPVLFCKTFLGHLFPKPMPWVHRGILAIATRKTDFLLKYGELDKIISHFVWSEDPDNPDALKHRIFEPIYNEAGEIISLALNYTKYAFLMIPRGFSKTTLFGQAVPIFQILYQERKFIVYISEAQHHAEMQINNIKTELTTNELIKTIWGDLRPDKLSDKKWTATFFETSTGIAIACRGRGGQIRGLNHKGQRPDMILFDDVEDKDSVRTHERRDTTLNWFYGDVMPALPALDDNATIIGLGTLLHPEALLMRLHGDPEWTSMIFSAIDNDGDPLWEDNMSLAQIEAKKKSYARVGKLSVFYMEYMSSIRADSDQKFQAPFIISPYIREELTGVAEVIDPAISEATGSDYCAIAIVGMTEKGHLIVMDVWGKVGASPREQVDIYFDKYLQHKPDKCGVESIAYQKALVHLLREEMFRRHAYFEIECITHGRTGKDERILGVLQPRYASGYISHSRHFTELEAQLLDYPNGKKDYPDAVAMAITLLDPYAAQAANPDIDLSADEYEDLDEVFDGDWRAY